MVLRTRRIWSTWQNNFYMKWSHICMYLRMYSVRVCTCLPGRPTNALMLRSMGLSFSGNSGTFTLLLSLWLGGWLQRGAIVSWQYTYLHVYCKMFHERHLKRHTLLLEDFSMFKTCFISGVVIRIEWFSMQEHPNHTCTWLPAKSLAATGGKVFRP